MNYGLKKPCGSCPFVIANDFRLNPERILEISQANGFSCHSTVDYDGAADEHGDVSPYRDQKGEHHCFGHLVVQWAEYGGFDQLTAWAARCGDFDPNELPTPEEAGVFETFGDYIDREEGR